MLMAAMATGRERAKISAVVGADASIISARLLPLCSRAAARSSRLHLSLDETRAQLRLPERAFGDESEKVPAPAGVSAEPLRIVA